MLFLGADIGGTKTAVVTADQDGHILSIVKDKGSNYQGCGKEESYRIINNTIQQTCSQLQINREDISASYFGVAGADLDYDFSMVRSILNRLELPSFQFENDGLIALRAGTPTGRGILVTCGTGSISFGNNGHEIQRKGGFSRFFGEKLGGYHVAGLVASAIVRGDDGRSHPTIMHQLLKKEFNITIQEMMKDHYPDQNYQGPDVNIALISTLYKAAHMKDLAALRILTDIALEVIQIVSAFRISMEFKPVINLILEGSVFKKADDILMQMLRSGLGEEYRLIIPEHDPVIGALMFALEQGGIEITQTIYQRLINTYHTVHQTLIEEEKK